MTDEDSLDSNRMPSHIPGTGDGTSTVGDVSVQETLYGKMCNREPNLSEITHLASRVIRMYPSNDVPVVEGLERFYESFSKPQIKLKKYIAKLAMAVNLFYDQSKDNRAVKATDCVILAHYHLMRLRSDHNLYLTDENCHRLWATLLPIAAEYYERMVLTPFFWSQYSNVTVDELDQLKRDIRDKYRFQVRVTDIGPHRDMLLKGLEDI